MSLTKCTNKNDDVIQTASACRWANIRAFTRTVAERERKCGARQKSQIISQTRCYICWPSKSTNRSYSYLNQTHLHRMKKSRKKMKPKLPTIAAKMGMSYSLVDCLNSGWIISQFGCSVICQNHMYSRFAWHGNNSVEHEERGGRGVGRKKQEKRARKELIRDLSRALRDDCDGFVWVVRVVFNSTLVVAVVLLLKQPTTSSLALIFFRRLRVFVCAWAASH